MTTNLPLTKFWYILFNLTFLTALRLTNEIDLSVGQSWEKQGWKVVFLAQIHPISSEDIETSDKWSKRVFVFLQAGKKTQTKNN